MDHAAFDPGNRWSGQFGGCTNVLLPEALPDPQSPELSAQPGRIHRPIMADAPYRAINRNASLS
jgi:hypothetical protein